MRISDWSSDVCSSDLHHSQSKGSSNSPASCARFQSRSHSSAHPDTVTRICTVPISCHSRLNRSEEHTSELQSLMRISYAVFCLKKKKRRNRTTVTPHTSTYQFLAA